MAKNLEMHIKSSGTSRLASPLCILHQNLLALTKSGSCSASTLTNVCIQRQSHALIAATVCPPDDSGRYARPACTHRTCKDCGVGQLRDKLNPLLRAHTGGTVTWRKWESITYHHDQTVKTKKVLKTKTGALEELVLELLQEVAFLAQHLFVANWQKDMFNSAKQLPCSSTDTVVMVLDFDETMAVFTKMKFKQLTGRLIT